MTAAKQPVLSLFAAPAASSFMVSTSDERAEALKARLMARAASAGVSVFEMGCGGYAVGWSSREVPDLRALQRVLTQMGAPA